MKISLDTNILIDEPNILNDASKEFVISFTVIRELDKLKRNPELKRAAQHAIINVWNAYKNDRIEILNIPSILGESPDELIIADTKKAGASILSDDIGARIIARAYGVPISDFESDDNTDWDYTGYAVVKGTVNYEQDFVQIKELPRHEFEEQFDVSLKENQYVIIDRVVDKNDIWVHRDGKVSRISQSMSPLRSANVMDSPLDSIQMCAIHAILDEEVPLVVIDGAIGTGKTILSLIGALATTVGQKRYKFYEKIYVTRPPISVDHGMKLGYLPGPLNEKLGDWIGGVKSNLQFLLEKTDINKEKEIADEVFNDSFQMLNLDSIQGVSLHNAILLVDEYQLLSVDMLKLVLSRVSKGSKIVLIGDTKYQTYGINRANNGFRVLYKHLGMAKEMAFIRLDKIYRSALAKFVADIFN
jgi:PhoH-like ATPase